MKKMRNNIKVNIDMKKQGHHKDEGEEKEKEKENLPEKYHKSKTKIILKINIIRLI